MTDRAADAWGSVDGDRPELPAGRRLDVLTVLRGSVSPLSIAEIADRLEVHPNTVRFHLDALAEAGRVERVELPPAGPGRPPLVFRARRGMDPAGPRSYRLLAAVLVDDLAAGPDPVPRAVAAGRAWGRRLADRPGPAEQLPADEAVDRLVGLLDELGFAPEQRVRGDRRQIGLRHCPFLELVQTQAGVVCPLHLGLMQGATASFGGRVTVERLEPFAEPDVCLAHLGVPTDPPPGDPLPGDPAATNPVREVDS